MSVSPKTKRERSKNTYLQRSLLLDWVGAFGAEDIGIDLGTSNAVIYVKNKGLVFPVCGKGVCYFLFVVWF